MKIAVTGANGFVGSAAAESLSRAGHEIIPIVRKNTRALPAAVEWDITEPHEGAPLDAECVIHSAAVVDDGAGYADAYPVNVAGTKHVLDAFPHAQRFIFVSSASVYDPRDTAFSITEESPAGTHLLNGYSKTKFEAEELVRSHESSSRKMILRPHVIYGPHDWKIIPRILRAHRGGRFIVLGNGRNRISVTHIDNLCDAIKRCAEAEALPGAAVLNITDEGSVRVDDLIAHVKAAHGITAPNLYLGARLPFIIGFFLETLHAILGIKKPPFISRYIAHQMTSDHELSLAKAQALLGYRPIKSFTDYYPA